MYMQMSENILAELETIENIILDIYYTINYNPLYYNHNHYHHHYILSSFTLQPDPQLPVPLIPPEPTIPLPSKPQVSTSLMPIPLASQPPDST